MDRSAVNSQLGEIAEPPLSRPEVRRIQACVPPGEAEDAIVGLPELVRLVLDLRRLDDLDQRLVKRRLRKETRARVRARSVFAWAQAADTDEVRGFREEQLGGSHVPLTALGEWIGSRHTRRDRIARKWGWLDIPTDDGVRQVRVARGGQLYDLREVAVRLAGLYRWEPSEAVAFLVTGSIPVVEDIVTSTRRGRAGRRVVIECDLDVDPKAVMAALDAARRSMVPMRAPRPESFEMFAEWSVTGHLSWTDFAGYWNERHRAVLKPEGCRERIRRVEGYLGH